MRRTLTLAAFAASLCLWLGADTKPELFPVNALRGSIEATRLPDGMGYQLNYHKTDKLTLKATFPTFALAREEILRGMAEAGLTAEELEAARKDLDALEQTMGGTP